MASVSFVPRVALITGAAKGIGRAIALRLADEGLDVGVNDVASNAERLSEVVEEIQARGRQASSVIADVSEESQVKDMIEAVVEKLGRLDAMIANAGIPSKGSLIETSVEHWDNVMKVNGRGTMLCYKYAAMQMIKQGNGGRIIGASSMIGIRGAQRLAPYCASKFAIRGLTQSLALELMEHNITVNAYAPGLILTDMTANPLDAAFGGAHGATLKALLNVPLDSPEAGPDVVASIVAYLVKPEAYFVTGQTLSVDGGLLPR
ncbi:short chain oxidoreductase [Fomitopsis serialis]|uniref:short chain oxidoreductase n=1 Tax=Fomitopsis serialis TaxID=139415 RepID=UPI0020078140|nr:short chain oxidoreductase [Neoantrodia serialis]KAH9932208.1 short chain oxidoreductase [Neoantrodia serialis]